MVRAAPGDAILPPTLFDNDEARTTRAVPHPHRFLAAFLWQHNLENGDTRCEGAPPDQTRLAGRPPCLRSEYCFSSQWSVGRAATYPSSPCRRTRPFFDHPQRSISAL